MEREEGWYWVKHYNYGWIIAHYRGMFNVCGTEEGWYNLDDDFFEQIDERQIIRDGTE